MPTLSIITINRNNRAGLQKTIDSVISQTYKDYEWIVIDGASTDGSKELIEQYADHITYWVSEPDKGIYNAMNKGVRVAKGEYLQFLNSGDWLYDNNVLEQIIREKFISDFVIFDILLLYGNNKYEKRNIENLTQSTILRYLYKDTFPHQSTLIRRTLLCEMGFYDENYKYVADWCLFFKACVFSNATFEYRQGTVLACYDMYGISSVSSEQVKIERSNFLRKELPEPVRICVEHELELDNIISQLRGNKILYFIFRFLLKLASKLR